MKLTKAIQLQEQEFKDPGSVGRKDLDLAQRLGVEALKFHSIHYPVTTIFQVRLLPGETAE